MLLSIIIPTYNKEDKIARCLESLMRLEKQDVEFIVVNDGSTDQTQFICQKYQDLDSRIRLINKKNSGVSGARNVGIEESQGRYISFVDADDVITAGYNKIIQVIKEEKYNLYGFDYCTKDGSKIIEGRRPYFQPGLNDKKTLYNCFLTGFCNSICFNIYSSKIIHDNYIRFTEGMSMGEDSEFNSKYFRHSSEIYYINEVAYLYYIDDDSSATHIRKLSYLDDLQRMYRGFLDVYYLKENLQFPFDYEFYLNFAYEILRDNFGKISKEDNAKFRKSSFFRAITLHKCRSKKMEARRWYIKSNIYKFMKINI